MIFACLLIGYCVLTIYGFLRRLYCLSCLTNQSVDQLPVTIYLLLVKTHFFLHLSIRSLKFLVEFTTVLVNGLQLEVLWLYRFKK